jgi:peptidoglycan-associated lipoprotein
MKFQKILLALPVVFSLTACSCGNKISQGEGGIDGDSSVSGVNGMDVMESSSFFKGKVADRVFFATDKNTLNHESKHTLKEQAELLKTRPELNVVVEGHCDERGPREYNIALGERRANAAKEFLCHSGVNCDNVSTVSYGKEKPEVQGHDAEAWAQNRRAVTVVSEK